MRNWIFLFLVVICFSVHRTDGTCELPADLRGTWIDTFKGALEFGVSEITGYVFHTFGTLTLSCYQKTDTVYVMESTPFLYYGLNFTAYFCWNFTQVNSDMFYFYEYATPISDAGGERVKIYLPSLTRTYSLICANPNVGLGTYRLLFRNGTIDDAISECPPEINGYYKYDVRDETGTSTCNKSSNPLDACTNSSSLLYNGTDCSIPLAYSTSGSVYCLFNVEDSGSKLHYMSLYNAGDVDESSTFSITCMILSYASSSLRATQYPKQCPDDMNTSYVGSPGAYVYLNSPSSCSGSDAFPWWIIGVIVALLLLIAFIIFFLWYRKKKQEEKERRRRLLDEEDDERFDPDKFARGDRPPFVSITIMGDGRRRDKDGNIIPDEPPKIKRPKSEGGKRRLDKRKRVWVIDKDGKVKKVWKEAKDSPDSGVEDDEVDGEGGGSTGRKTISSAGTSRDGEDDDFAKKHGRKELKSAKEIEEKGEKDKNSAKLMRKMKGMMSSRRSARFRKSARSLKSRASRMKSAAYTHDDDGERSWGSDDGDYEEVDTDRLQKEMDDNKLNEEREKLGDDIVKHPKPEDVAPVAAVAVISETERKDGGKGRKGKKTKGKQKESKDDAKKKKKSETKTSDKGKLDDSTAKKEEGLADQPSTSGVVATATVVDEKATDKKEKETSKKPAEKKEVKKKTESKQTKKATEKKTPTGKGEQIEMEEKKAVTFREEDGADLSKAETAAIGAAAGGTTAAGAIVAVAGDKDKKEKSEAQLKAEQKKKVKEDLKRQKEERKKKEQEEKEAKKKAELEMIEKAKAKAKYGSEESKQDEKIVNPEEKKEEKSPKKDGEKPSGTDSGHVTPTSAEDVNKQDDDPAKPSDKDTTKTTKGKDEKPPQPPSREPTLSSSMRPRREQSIMLDLDNSRSGSATVTGEKRDSTTLPGEGKKALEVVAELVDTARNKAERLDNTLDESMVAATAMVPPLDLSSKDNESSKETGKSDVSVRRGDEGKEEKKENEKAKEETKKPVEKQQNKTQEGDKSKTGAKTKEDKNVPKKGVQIIVTEAEKTSKRDVSKRHDVIEEDENEDDDDSSGNDSSEPDLPVARRRKPQAQGFMFMDTGADNAFKQAGDILHTMPVKKKAGRRKARAAPADVATTLPQRTNQAFGVSGNQKAKITAVAKVKAATSAAANKGPMTIQDISKKLPTEQADKSPRRASKAEPPESSSSKSGQTTQRSGDPKDRKGSEVDQGQHLKLMTRLMSLVEGDEGAEGGSPSRAQSSKSRKSRLERAELSARARAEEAAELDGDPVAESMNTPDALLTSRQGPILPGLPPTQHVLSRASSAGTRARPGIVRSASDSRQAWNTDTVRSRNTHSSSSTGSEDRFVRFKQGVMKQLEELGQQEMNAIMYPRVQRYPDDAPSGHKRGTPAYRSVGTLQRIHRKNNKVGPLGSELPPIQGAYGRMIDDYDDADDPRLKLLLEELYKDKKYMDKTLRENPEEMDFVRERTIQGRSFLLNRARFWSTQQPIKRPGTQATSRASTAMPPPLPGEISYRTRSEERPTDRKD